MRLPRATLKAAPIPKRGPHISVLTVVRWQSRFLGPGQHRENLQEENAEDSTNNTTKSDLRRHRLSPYVSKDASGPQLDLLFRLGLILNAAESIKGDVGLLPLTLFADCENFGCYSEQHGA
jgi:hypothetical protein